MSTYHPEQLKKKNWFTAREESCDSSSQPSPAKVLECSKPFAFHHPQAVEITRSMGKMIAVDNKLFYVVVHAGFKCLMALDGTILQSAIK